MKRLLIGLIVLSVLAVAFLVRPREPAASSDELRIQVADHNPWTHLRLNNDRNDFRFAVVSDRTGGPRDGVFERAIEKLNLMQPEFVLSVGDLIDGTSKPDVGDRQWQEFDGMVARLQPPFFYLPGNHDFANSMLAGKWQQRFGRGYYHFVYKNVLFLMLNTEDPPGGFGGHFGTEQLAYVRATLEDNRDVRWSFVLMHKPLWTYSDLEATGLLDLEKLLSDRKYTAFAGHRHRYERVERNGRVYYQFATTGGASKLRGVKQGEFDHIVWVTMKKDGPVIANLLLDGVYADDLKDSRAAETPARTNP